MRRVVLFLALLGAPGCEDPTQSLALRVSAASSLTELVDHVAAEFPGVEGGRRVQTSFMASSAAARQVEAGAPVDVIVSADRRWIDYLDEHDLIRARRELFGNDLVLIAPRGACPSNGLDALGAFEGRLAVGDPEHVPAGIYAQQALQSLGRWEALRDRLAPSANVRAALTLVEQGACPLGIVYASDAQASERVEVVAVFSTAGHEPVRYHGAVTAHGDLERGRLFLSVLAAHPSVEAFGFQPLPE